MENTDQPLHTARIWTLDAKWRILMPRWYVDLFVAKQQKKILWIYGNNQIRVLPSDIPPEYKEIDTMNSIHSSLDPGGRLSFGESLYVFMGIEKPSQSISCMVYTRGQVANIYIWEQWIQIFHDMNNKNFKNLPPI